MMMKFFIFIACLFAAASAAITTGSAGDLEEVVILHCYLSGCIHFEIWMLSKLYQYFHDHELYTYNYVSDYP